MLVSDFLTAVNQALRGIDDDVPTFGDEEATYWLGVANRKQQEWARDTKQSWESRWTTESLSPVVAAGTQSYNLPATLLIPSDRVYVTTTDSKDVYYNLIKPQERDYKTGTVYISSANPQELTFVDDIEADDSIVGGTVYVPGYYTLDDLDEEDDVILVDDPNWLVYATASEIAFNDIVYEDRAEGLNNKANNLYTMMAQTNRRGSYKNPRRLAYGNSYRIKGYRS